MKLPLSLLVIAKNEEEMLPGALSSVSDIVSEIVLIDNNSTDNTVKIAKKYKARVYKMKTDDYGIKRAFALQKCNFPWVLVLDADERVTNDLKKEIVKIIKSKKTCDAYYIFSSSHFLGHHVKYGGEHYKKLIFFKKNAVTISPALVHEFFIPKTKKVGTLKNELLHYSYRSLSQTFKKFHLYAIRDAYQKYKKGEKLNFSKLFLYAPHMFFARFIKDEGYRDGFFRIPLDLGFAYMEFATYWFLFLLKIRDNFFKIKKLF